MAVLEREAKAMANDPMGAARLYHEIGLLYEEPLKNPRGAAVAFQNAYRLAPRLVANLRSARRLFSDVGNWQMVAQLLEAEMAATEDVRSRAALLFEKGAVLEDRLSRHEDARAAYVQCLDLDAKDEALLIQLETLFGSRNETPLLLRTYKALAQATQDPQLKAQYLFLSGVLTEERLKDPAGAADLYRQAFGVDRQNPLILSAIKTVAEREGNTDELLAALTADAELLGAQAAPTYLQMSKVYERAGRKEDARAALMAARRTSPREPLVLSALASAYESEGRHEELADVLLSWVQTIQDEGELIAVNLRLAALYEETLKRDPDAIERYQAILARVPGHMSALAGLGKLYHRTREWNGLLWVFEQEAQTTDDPRQKVGRQYRAAEILEERLGRVEDAIIRYNQCLATLPGYLPAQKALARLYEKHGRFAELVSMYEQDLLSTEDKDQQVTTLHRMAALYEEKLSDLDRAIDCMKRVLDHQPDHLPTLRNLARLFEQAGKWRELIEINDREASLASDTKQVLSLHHRNAQILDERLEDPEGAIGAYERLLALSPSYLPALQALGRLYAHDARWTELARMYQAEAEIAASTEQAAALMAKIGELYEIQLKDNDKAVAAYQEVLTLAPSYFPALRALARIYRAQGATESWVDVLRSEAANRTDPVERANVLYQAASLWEDPLKRQDLAVEGFQEVLRLVPGHAAALRALERIHTMLGQTRELVAVLDRETQTGLTPESKVTAYLKLGRLYLERLEEPAKAAQSFEAVLGLDPQNLAALKWLERVRAPDRARRADVKARLSDRIRDPLLQNALRLSNALEADTLPASERLAELRKALEADPRNSRLTFTLERALRQGDDAQGLLTLYETQLLGIQSAEEKAELSLRAADVAERKLGDPKKALMLYQKALDHRPAYLPALQGISRMALQLGDWGEARDALQGEGELALDPRTAVDAHIAAARISVDHLDEAEAGAHNYRKALERDPLDPVASRGLEELLANRGGATDLALLHERRAEAKLAQRDPNSAAEELFAAAQIWLKQSDERAKALSAVERALGARPTHAPSLELRAQLALEDHQYAEAAAALAGRLQQGGEARVLSGVHLKLGAIHQDHLGDPNRAAAHLQSALAGDPRNVEALERLSTLHLVSRNWTGAADTLRRLLEIETLPAAVARHTLALARIMDEGFGDLTQATQLYRRALELAPQEPLILDRLVALYERSNHLPELVQMLEGQVSRTVEPERQLALLKKVADIQAGPLGQPLKAIDGYRRIVEREPRHTGALEALAALYMRDAASSNQAIDTHRRLLALDPTRLDSLHSLFRLWDGLQQRDRAFCVAGILVFLQAANDSEQAFHAHERTRLPAETTTPLQPVDIEVLMHPDARGAVTDILRAIGDQLTKLYPPHFEAIGVEGKADRLKSDHPVFKTVKALAQQFNVPEFEVYQARRGTVTLETTKPLAICVGQDVVRRFADREQRFLLGRGVLGLYNKTAVLLKLSASEAADLIGQTVRIHAPNFSLLGRRNDDVIKQLKKLYSSKTLRSLEEPSQTLAGTPRLDLTLVLQGLAASADRAGLLVSGDPASSLNMAMREELSLGGARNEGADVVSQMVRQRPDLQSLIQFALSEEFFRLRQRFGPSLS